MQLEGKVALITGAGSGIGKAAALLLAREGAKVAALSHTQAEVEQTSQEIKQTGGAAMAVVADIGNPEQMQKAVKQTIDKWG
jgi:NAD(P)-dependent dehydrogenase (short-subunit alcohol dehydrogenase family)